MEWKVTGFSATVGGCRAASVSGPVTFLLVALHFASLQMAAVT
jgi:hypothetical protein